MPEIESNFPLVGGAQSKRLVAVLLLLTPLIPASRVSCPSRYSSPSCNSLAGGQPLRITSYVTAYRLEGGCFFKRIQLAFKRKRGLFSIGQRSYSLGAR